MDMRINGSDSSSQSVGAANWQQRQQNVKSMMSAIQSGDLSGAQKAYAALNVSGQDSGNGPFAAIGKALQSGDIQGAQKAAQDLQAKRAGHHHHHQESASSSSTTTPTTGNQPLADSGPGSTINILA